MRIEGGEVAQDDDAKILIREQADVGPIAGVAPTVPDPAQATVLVDDQAAGVVERLATAELARLAASGRSSVSSPTRGRARLATQRARSVGGREQARCADVGVVQHRLLEPAARGPAVRVGSIFHDPLVVVVEERAVHRERLEDMLAHPFRERARHRLRPTISARSV